MTPKRSPLLDRAVAEASNTADKRDRHLIRKLKSILVSGNQALGVGALLSELGCTKDKLLDLIAKLANSGMLVTIHRGVVTITLEPPAGTEVHEIKAKGVQVIRYGVVSDTHLASKYARLDALSAMYDIFHEEGITEVLLPGNIIDGEARFNRHDLLVHGIEGQTSYLIDNFPQRKGVVTKFITGDDHEGWYAQREGIDIGRYMADCALAQGRTDLVYLGHMEHDIELKRPGGSAHLRVLHGGGGSPYAYSYVSQKTLEAFQGGEKPTIVLIGHHHKFDHTYPRGSHAVMCGAFQDQTPFLRKKRIEVMLGGLIVEIRQDDRGIVQSFGVRWYPFYDRSFYKGKTWKYHWSRPQ